MDEFADDRDEVIARALDAGVGRILAVGTSVAASEKAVALADKYQPVFAAVGIHPHDALGITSSDIARLRELAKHRKVVALGEMGLDFYRMYSPKDAQSQAIEWQLKLSIELELPVIIHARQATKEMMYVLGEWVRQRGETEKRPPGVIHCFGYNNLSLSEDLKVAHYYLDLGFYLSFGGYISYPGSNAPAVIKELPADRLLLETDCPFLPPQLYRARKRNEPSFITEALKIMAEARGVSSVEMSRQTTENANTLFRFDR